MDLNPMNFLFADNKAIDKAKEFLETLKNSLGESNDSKQANRIFRNSNVTSKLFEFLKNYPTSSDGANGSDNISSEINIVSDIEQKLKKIEEIKKEQSSKGLKTLGFVALFIFAVVLMTDPSLVPMGTVEKFDEKGKLISTSTFPPVSIFAKAQMTGSLATFGATIPFLVPLLAFLYYGSGYLNNQSKISKFSRSLLTDKSISDQQLTIDEVLTEIQKAIKITNQTQHKEAHVQPIVKPTTDVYHSPPLAQPITGVYPLSAPPGPTPRASDADALGRTLGSVRQPTKFM